MQTPVRRGILILALATLILAVAGALSRAQSPSPRPEPQPTSAAGGASSVPPSFQELFEISQKERRGLMFFLNGQTVGGLVIRMIGTEAVEVRNQTYSRIIIRLDRIDAVALN